MIKTALIYLPVSTHQTTAMGKTLDLLIMTCLTVKWTARTTLKICVVLPLLPSTLDLTSFRTYQKEVIHEYLNGRDTIVVQPTGSGKSLCYQFPAVYTGKMSIVISPMISLMVDQVAKLKRQGVSSTYLGSAHHDKTLEHNILHGNTDITVLFVTPEWLFSSNKIELVRQLVQEKKVALIAVDEAHLIFEWQTFREQYKKVETLKQEYLNVPFMLLTATATPEIMEKLQAMFVNPLISKSTVNRRNVKYLVEKLPPKGRPMELNRGDYSIFGQRVTDIVGSECAIVYTDFIADVGPILCALRECRLSCAGYYGEIEPTDRQESYDQWMT